MNTLAHLVARALRDRQTLATTDNPLRHRIRIHAPRATILRLVRTGVLTHINIYLTPRAPTSGSITHYIRKPPPPTAAELEAARLAQQAEHAATRARTERTERERCIHHLTQADALLTSNGDHTADSRAALLQILTSLREKNAKSTLQ